MQPRRLICLLVLTLPIWIGGCGSGGKNTTNNSTNSNAPLVVTPTLVTAGLGRPAVFTVAVQSTTPPTAPIVLNVTGLPANAGAAFAPSQIMLTPGTTSGTSTLTITPSSGTPVGNYPLLIQGTANNAVFGTAQVTLSVQPIGTLSAFTLAVAPPSAIVSRNVPASFLVTVSPTGGFVGTVNLMVSGGSRDIIVRDPTPNPLNLDGSNPAQATFVVTFIPGVSNIGSSTTLTVTASGGTTTQSFPVSVQTQP